MCMQCRGVESLLFCCVYMCKCMYMHLPICICIYIRIDKHDEDPLYYAPFLDADLLYMNAESDLSHPPRVTDNDIVVPVNGPD